MYLKCDEHVCCRFYQDQRLCDITLRVESTEFRSHKIVLAASSLYFERMFSSDMTEQNASEIELNGLSAVAIKHLIDFAYSSELYLNTDTVLEIFEAADMLQFMSARNFCQEFLSDQIDISNCLSFILYGHTFSSETLYDKAIQCASFNFKAITSSKAFLHLPELHLSKLLASDNLDMEYEEHVYEAMRSWVTSSLPERRSAAARLIQRIRLNFVSRWYLIEVISKDPIISDCEAANKAVQTAKDQLLAQGHTYDIPWTMPASRRLTGMTEKLLFLNTASVDTGEIVLFDVLNKSWSNLSQKCPNASDACTIERLSHVLLVIGGWNKKAGPIGPVNKLHEFQVMACFPKLEYAGERYIGLRRFMHSSIILNDVLYIIGGADELLEPLPSLLSAKREENYRVEWRSNMFYPVLRPAVCSIDSRIYVFGGYDRKGYAVHAVQVYESNSNSWHQLPPSDLPKVAFSYATYCDGSIYLLCDSECNVVAERRIDTVFSYCVTSRTFTKQCDLVTSRSGAFSAVYLNGKIYVAGGVADGRPCNILECFDICTKTFDVVCKTRPGKDLSLCTTIKVMHENFGL